VKPTARGLEGDFWHVFCLWHGGRHGFGHLRVVSGFCEYRRHSMFLFELLIALVIALILSSIPLWGRLGAAVPGRCLGWPGRLVRHPTTGGLGRRYLDDPIRAAALGRRVASFFAHRNLYLLALIARSASNEAVAPTSNPQGGCRTSRNGQGRRSHCNQCVRLFVLAANWPFDHRLAIAVHPLPTPCAAACSILVGTG